MLKILFASKLWMFELRSDELHSLAKILETRLKVYQNLLFKIHVTKYLSFYVSRKAKQRIARSLEKQNKGLCGAKYKKPDKGQY